MTQNLVKEMWLNLAGRRTRLVEAFYGRLFQRYPEYRDLFPAKMEAQTERMVLMLSNATAFSDDREAGRIYLRAVGRVHRNIGIGTDDVKRFIDVLLETLAETYPEPWEPRHEAAWRDAFERIVIPYFEEGLSAEPDRVTESLSIRHP